MYFNLYSSSKYYSNLQFVKNIYKANWKHPLIVLKMSFNLRLSVKGYRINFLSNLLCVIADICTTLCLCLYVHVYIYEINRTKSYCCSLKFKLQQKHMGCTSKNNFIVQTRVFTHTDRLFLLEFLNVRDHSDNLYEDSS